MISSYILRPTGHTACIPRGSMAKQCSIRTFVRVAVMVLRFMSRTVLKLTLPHILLSFIPVKQGQMLVTTVPPKLRITRNKFTRKMPSFNSSKQTPHIISYPDDQLCWCHIISYPDDQFYCSLIWFQSRERTTKTFRNATSQAGSWPYFHYRTFYAVKGQRNTFIIKEINAFRSWLIQKLQACDELR